METFKEILLCIVIIILILGSIFFIGKWMNGKEGAQANEDGKRAINDVIYGTDTSEFGDNVVKGLEYKNNKTLHRYVEKYNDNTIGYVAYILSRIQIYSIPICTLLFVIGAFLYWVISAKKFVEAEKGYGYIVSSIIFLAIAQVAPLVFALIVTVGK